MHWIASPFKPSAAAASHLTTMKLLLVHLPPSFTSSSASLWNGGPAPEIACPPTMLNILA